MLFKIEILFKFNEQNYQEYYLSKFSVNGFSYVIKKLNDFPKNKKANILKKGNIIGIAYNIVYNEINIGGVVGESINKKIRVKNS